MIAESVHNKEHLFYFDWTEQCKYCEQSNQCLYKEQFYEYCNFLKNMDDYFLKSKGTSFELCVASVTSGVKVNCDWFKFSEEIYHKIWSSTQVQGTTPVEDNNCTAK